VFAAGGEHRGQGTKQPARPVLRAPEGTNWPSLSSHSLPKPSASMKPVSTETPAWEISDWPVKLTGRDGKTG
jgi:hypothetical protein